MDLVREVVLQGDGDFIPVEGGSIEAGGERGPENFGKDFFFGERPGRVGDGY